MARHVSSCDDHVKYVPGCEPCKERARDYAYRRHWGVYGGTWDRMVEGDALRAVVDHLKALLAHRGVTVPLVAAAAGTGHSNIYRLLSGQTVAMRPDVAQAILDVTAELALRKKPNAFVDITGVSRRLQALAADGWSSEALSALCGINAATLGHWRSRQRPSIRAGSAQKVFELYEKIRALADPRGPSEMAVRWASDLGYLPPERWADEDIDNPDAEPLPPLPDDDDHVEISNLIQDALMYPAPGKAAGYDRPLKAEIARHALNRLGWSLPRVAELLGYKSVGAVEYLVNGRKDRPHTRGGTA